MLHSDERLSIVGGGLAALSTAAAASKEKIPYEVFGDKAQWGGLATTYQLGKFSFDLWPQVLTESPSSCLDALRQRLGRDWIVAEPKVCLWTDSGQLTLPADLPWAAWQVGPLALSSAVLNRGVRGFKAAQTQVALQRRSAQQFGGLFARRYVVRCLERLWGRPAEQLLGFAGDLYTRSVPDRYLVSALAQHLMKRAGFAPPASKKQCYPAFGLGQLAEALRKECESSCLQLEAPVAKLVHTGADIHGIELKDGSQIPTDQVVWTLPLPRLVARLSPRPDSEVQRALKSIRYRSWIHVVVFIDQPNVTGCGIHLFNQSSLPFTRISEPKNLSPFMAPRDQTCLVVELPCEYGGALWRYSDRQLRDRVLVHLERLKLLSSDWVIDSQVYRVPRVCVIPDLKAQEAIKVIQGYCSRLRNLRLPRAEDPWDLLGQVQAGKDIVGVAKKELAEAALL